MKTNWIHAVAVAGLMSTGVASGQFGPGMSGPAFGGKMSKLFGEHSAFSATMEMQGGEGGPMGALTMTGKLAVQQGKSRFEMDMGDMKGKQIPPEAVAQMKAMGMDKMVMISRPDKKASYLIYPGLKAYAEMPIQDANAGSQPEDFKIDVTEQGKETVDGHPCVKNKAVVTDKEGKKYESMLWNATDLKGFPVKIEQKEGASSAVMHFKDVKFASPSADLFEPPVGFKRYDNPQAMMQEEMMKRIGGR